ncbi:hypothetical protein T4D_14601 [Trichinella pseudospiralis]|uniref:Uncharacterized protein n=1 Tax=Trichinella pseudospiralis TaxID=6337 RepID=A0A0V1FZ03_TRIPS|nr:hypothetical protein T4D_14601 [Trichinella pseudospiralis]
MSVNEAQPISIDKPTDLFLLFVPYFSQRCMQPLLLLFPENVLFYEIRIHLAHLDTINNFFARTLTIDSWQTLRRKLKIIGNRYCQRADISMQILACVLETLNFWNWDSNEITSLRTRSERAASQLAKVRERTP